MSPTERLRARVRVEGEAEGKLDIIPPGVRENGSDWAAGTATDEISADILQGTAAGRESARANILAVE